ncbi:MAG: 4Fe-4S binding protein [bacterium]|nr:MAG: 4Fe-4S binding protein [bacterium]
MDPGPHLLPRRLPVTRLVYLGNVSSLQLSEDRCSGCGMCTVVCPHTVMVLVDGRTVISDLDACMECGACARNCPEDAITVESGVGCAQAVINTALGRSSVTCCTITGESEEDTDGTPPVGSGSGCC